MRLRCSYGCHCSRLAPEMGRCLYQGYWGAVGSDLISYGAGVNSTALVILMVNEGWRGPIVIADTGVEWPETYCYMDCFEREWLVPRGLAITRLGGEWRPKTRCAERSLIDYCEHYGMIPLAGIRWCTTEYKVRPLNAWALANGIEVQHIGIAADEVHRQKGRSCPLIDGGITREGCIEIIQAEGLDVPQKSGCYVCPFQRDAQWHKLYRLHPGLFERVARLEEAATERRGVFTALAPSGRVSLRMRQERYERQLPMFEETDWDGMLRFQPCVCTR